MDLAADERVVQELRSAIGEARFATYVELADGSDSVAWQLYEWNVRVSAALLVPLGLLEVILRNRLFQVMAARFGQGWPGRHDLLGPSEQRKVETASRYLRRKGLDDQGEALITELSFGFWVGMLSKRYDQSHWRSTLYTAFSPRTSRHDIHDRLDHARTLRNRIAHHEHLLRRNLAEDVERIDDILRRISPAAAAWARSISNAPAVIAQRPVPLP